MAVCDVLNIRAEKVGEVDLDDALFNVEVNAGILHEVVCQRRAAQRSGNASTKTRGEVRGGGAKPWRQKGTGRARAGSRTSPLWRGGGTVFGPKPRDYSYTMPKKVRKLALKMALSARNQEGNLLLLDNFELPSVKTKDFVAVLDALSVQDCLIVVDEMEKNLDLSSRNVVGVKVLPVAGLNVYDILKYTKLMLVQASLDGIKQRLTK
ncbi:MAG: 50S ribosomal protein L4 [Desulfobulbaceae bacterium]|nr:50S ribosomal protein L4 [Desulfobulbaceae bacterium]